jgi:hypothetical protein
LAADGNSLRIPVNTELGDSHVTRVSLTAAYAKDNLSVMTGDAQGLVGLRVTTTQFALEGSAASGVFGQEIRRRFL